MAKVFRIIIPVSDIEKAAAFYRKLLVMEGERVSPGRHYFDCEGVILACFDPRADGDDFDAVPNPGHIYLTMDDLEATHARAMELNCPVSSIKRQAWGERSFYTEDPFGNPLCFVERTTEFKGRGG